MAKVHVIHENSVWVEAVARRLRTARSIAVCRSAAAAAQRYSGEIGAMPHMCTVSY
jgi:hypothetical protein